MAEKKPVVKTPKPRKVGNIILHLHVTYFYIFLFLFFFYRPAIIVKN